MSGTTITTMVGSLLMVLVVQTVYSSPQRPTYAGSRPGGLSQKDKYHTTTTQTTVDGITNRFGETNDTTTTNSNSNSNPNSNTNSIPFGAAQRPPIGWPVVSPHPQYIPLNVNQPTTPQFALDNRISGNDIGGNGVAAGGATGGGVGANSVNPTITGTNIGAAGNGFGFGFPGPFGGQPGFSNVPPQFQPQPQPIAPLPVVSGQLPLDAHGDQALIDYLNTVPVDQRPFWFLNYQAIEAQRNSTSPTFTGAVGGRGSFFG